MMAAPESSPFTAYRPASNLKDYRNALGAFGTGVAVVTAAIEGRPIGLTVNSFTSVSLEPALILWSIDCQSNHYDDFAYIKHFAVHVLTMNQQGVADRFSTTDVDKFNEYERQCDSLGVPVIPDSLVRFQCQRHGVQQIGDHRVIFGQVVGYNLTEGSPLLFVHGRYQHL